MRKRLTTGLVATTAVLMLSGVTPALANSVADDNHPAVPCNPYPPGKKYHISAAPTSITIRKGANMNAYATAWRGEGSDRQGCKYHVTSLRFTYAPNHPILNHRTNANGVAAYVIKNVTSSRRYFFYLVLGNTLVKSNIGSITVR